MAKRQDPGTQSDRFETTSDMRPVVPSCDGLQFNQETDYFDYRYDKWNNEIPDSRPYNHTTNTAGQGKSGNLLFDPSTQDIAGSGYASGCYGNNETKYGEGPAFQQASSVIVDVSRADRGRPD